MQVSIDSNPSPSPSLLLFLILPLSIHHFIAFLFVHRHLLEILRLRVHSLRLLPKLFCGRISATFHQSLMHFLCEINFHVSLLVLLERLDDLFL